MGMGCHRGGLRHSLLAYDDHKYNPSGSIRASLDSSDFSNQRNCSHSATNCPNVREKVMRGAHERTWTLSRVVDTAASLKTNTQPPLSDSGLVAKKGNVQTSIGRNANFEQTFFDPNALVTNRYGFPTLSKSRSPSYLDKTSDSEYATPKICVGFDPRKLHLKDLSPVGQKSSESTSFTPNEITEVIPNKLYLGCQLRASNDDELMMLGITHILSVTNSINPIKGIKHKHFVMSDFGKSELNTILDKVYPFMESAQRSQNKLYVHCTFGQNRSPTVIISFLMKNKGLTLYEAHKMLKEKRRLIQIHPNYAKMLLKLEKELLGETSLPDDWMEPNGRDSVGIPRYKCEELTKEQQQLFKSSQKLLKEHQV